MTRRVTEETRARISAAMKGKRNAAGPHKMTPAGRRAIQKTQRERWRRWRKNREEG